MPKIAKVVVPISVDKEFDYSYPEKLSLKKGMRVLVDFNHKKRVGLVVNLCKESKIKRLKPIIDALDVEPTLANEHMRLARQLSNIYPYPMAEFLFMMLPAYLKKTKKSDLKRYASITKRNNSPKNIFIRADNFSKRYLLWRDKIAEKLKSGSVLLCFPQLTYLNHARKYFEKDFPGKVKVIYSQKNEKELFAAWVQSREKSLILGTRVSIFYYPQDLNMVVVEEENSQYYFQEEKPFHNLFDIAWLLCRQKGADLILSGDYPSLATYKLIKDSKVELIDKAGPDRVIEVVNISESRKPKIIGPILSELLRKKIQENKRSVVLWNRKGFARVISCLSCGHVLRCAHCSGFLQSSLKGQEGICPYCQRKTPLPERCQHCRGGYFKSGGFGIERVESLLKRIFPEAKIDNWQEHSSDTQITLSTSKILSHLYDGEIFDCGFVLDIDSFLARTDYDSTFAAFLYLRKLIFLCKNNFYVFTRNKDYYLFQYLNKPWQDFYDAELILRQQLHLPPLGLIAKMVIRGKNENSLLKITQGLYNKLEKRFNEVYGPLPEQPFKLRDKFRYSLVVKTKKNIQSRKDIKEEVSSFRTSSLKIAVSLR